MTDVPADEPQEMPPMEEPTGIPDGEQPIQPETGGSAEVSLT